MMIRQKGGQLILFVVDFRVGTSDDLMKEGSDDSFL
jgi:hypothetical protein